MVAVVAGVASPAAGLLVVAVAAGVAAAVFGLLPVAERAAPSKPVERSSLLEGAVALWRAVPLRGSTVATTVSFVGAAGVLPVAVALFAGQLGHPPSAGAVFLSVFAVGALVASVALSARPLRRAHARRTVYLSVLATGVLLAAAAASPSYAVALVLFAAAGIADTPMLTATFMIRNEYTPAAVRTQVFTTAAGLKIGSSAVGSAIAGVLAAPVGGAGLLLVAAGVQVLALGVGLLSERLPARR